MKDHYSIRARLNGIEMHDVAFWTFITVVICFAAYFVYDLITHDRYAVQMVSAESGNAFILDAGKSQSSCENFIAVKNWEQSQASPKQWTYNCIKMPDELKLKSKY